MANYLCHQEVVLSFYKNFYSPQSCLDDKYIVNYFFSLNIIVDFYKNILMKIVITGGPGTGKTSIINKLESLGHHVFHESSREIIRKYKKLGHDQLFLSNPIKFSEILLKNRIKQYEESNKSNSYIKFFDRGIPDIIAYLNYKKISFGKEFESASKKYKYDFIFLAEPWEDIYKKDKERYESFEDLKIINKYIKKTYSNYAQKFITLPKSSVQGRINFIIESIK